MSKPRAYSSLMMKAVRTSETSVDNHLHGNTTQKTALNIILAAVRTWNLTCEKTVWPTQLSCRSWGCENTHTIIWESKSCRQWCWIFGTSFYDAFSVARLYNVDNRVTSEWWWIDEEEHPYLEQDSNPRSQESKRSMPISQTALPLGPTRAVEHQCDL
jgi:hypothetical protein